MKALTMRPGERLDKERNDQKQKKRMNAQTMIDSDRRRLSPIRKYARNRCDRVRN